MPRDGQTQASQKMGRHQACHRCRRRKLKCDGAIPCGPCKRAHAFEVRTRPSTALAKPLCMYDDPDIASDRPKARIARLENENAELRALLDVANARLAACTCGIELEALPGSNNLAFVTTLNLGIESPFLANGSVNSERVQQVDAQLSSGSLTPIGRAINVSNPANLGSSPLDPMMSAVDPTLLLTAYTSTLLCEMIPAFWPPDLPPPSVLHHLVETFFTSVPLASRLLHKPSFILALQKPPSSRDFPHVALLHAICGLASLYSPVIADPNLDRARTMLSQGWFNPRITSAIDPTGTEDRSRRLPTNLLDLLKDGSWEEGFGAAHMRLASVNLRPSVREGDRLLQMLQAAIVCVWYMYSMGMSIGVYTWISTVTSLVASLGVYTSEGLEPLSRLSNDRLFLLRKPRDAVEAETIRNVFWISYVMERVYNAGTVWPLAITDEYISQILPCRFSDFVAGEQVPVHSRQHIFTKNMLTSHQPLMTDSWTLYIKASILVSRVKAFNCRYRILRGRTDRPTETHYNLPRESEEFRQLDQAIHSFLQEIPRAYKDPIGATVDPLLYMAHLLPHVAMIQLHDPHADLSSPNDQSTMRMLTAVQAILDLIYKLCGTTFDLLYMDHSCSFCWFVAGAAIIRFLKVKIEESDQEQATRLEQELGIVKFMLKNLGDRIIIGHRQVLVLEDIYNTEINGDSRTKPIPEASEKADTANLLFSSIQ